jgi:hypothetical protein
MEHLQSACAYLAKCTVYYDSANELTAKNNWMSSSYNISSTGFDQNAFDSHQIENLN